VKVIGHKIVGNDAVVTVKAFAAGRISGSGKGVGKVTRSVSKASTVTLKIPLKNGQHKPLKTKIRIGFVPKAKGGAHSAASVTVKFG
jgi:hypothetical protein